MLRICTGVFVRYHYLILHKICYGLRSNATTFHGHLAERIRRLGFKPSKANADLYIRAVKGSHYEMIAIYVDDLLRFSKNPMSLISEFKKDYDLKGVGEPEYYLGGNVERPINVHRNHNSSICYHIHQNLS